jgi:RNA polymerase sigma factor (sigma-70 family)
MSSRRDDDRTTFNKLYRSTRGDLLTYLVRRTANADDAADALSETYLIAWRKLDAIPPGEKSRLWLFGVARNVLLKDASRRRAGGALVDRITDELRASSIFTPGLHPSARHDRLATALAALSDLDREIIILTAWEELTPKEIAVVLGKSANSVRIRLHRARSRLKDELAAAHPTARDPDAMPVR